MTNTCLGWLRPLLALAALPLASGCSDLDNCPESRDPITVDRPGTDTDALLYQSTPDWETFDEFPAKTEIIFKHGLGVTPATVSGFLAFTKDGANRHEAGSFSAAAGNLIVWECLDSDTIVIKNDTCERSLFVRITAQGVPSGETDNHDCSE